MITIYYGNSKKYINITRKTLELRNQNNIIIIPGNDIARSRIFSDPVPGEKKVINVIINNYSSVWDYRHTIYIDLFLLSKIRFTPKTIIRGYISPENNKIYPNNIFPIAFSFPKHKIVSGIPDKKKILSSLIPGNLDTYIYNNETDYYNEYQKSMFGITCLKAGWDCMRHYELMANGCIPYFLDIQECPKNTMSLLPKNLFIEGNMLFNKLQKKRTFTVTDIQEYKALATKMIEFTRTNLTTEVMANYILNKTNHNNASKILYIGISKPDYLSTLTLHGFKMRLGKNCHEYPKQNYLYTNNNIDLMKIYGKGITYSELIDVDLRDDTLDETLIEDIKNKYYDIVIFSCYYKSMEHYELINSIYEPNEIILMCGADVHDGSCISWSKKGHSVFVRELL